MSGKGSAQGVERAGANEQKEKLGGAKILKLLKRGIRGLREETQEFVCASPTGRWPKAVCLMKRGGGQITRSRRETDIPVTEQFPIEDRCCTQDRKRELGGEDALEGSL